jgi:hypothetical protein
MIPFRYHIVTIVAVFLALAVGLLAGSSFVDPALTNQLREQTDQLTNDLRDRDDQIAQNRQDIAGLEGFVDVATAYLTRSRLLGQEVIVVAQEGVEDAVVSQAQRSLTGAGAEVVAMVEARDQIASQDPETQRRLAEIVGAQGAPADQLPALTAAALATRLVAGSGGAAPEDDVLAELLSEGFLAPIGSGLSTSTVGEIGGPDQSVVVLAGGQNEKPALPPQAFAVPLVDALATGNAAAVAGESTTTKVVFVADVRGTDGLVTVDDLDLGMGGVALVLGLDELLTSGQGGDYGIKDGAEPLPPLP